MERVFKRKLYDSLLDWKKRRAGKTALLVEGARRVGKSTLVEYFAQKEYDSYLLIDFNKAPKRVLELFEDISNLDNLFMQLQLHYSVVLHERKSVIVFDEVQKCPLARQAIKYLVQDGRYDYIETGSLISIKKNTKNITIPSEEVRVNMFPMDFEEFRWAVSDNISVPLIKQFFDKGQALRSAHQKILFDFRLYMLVGGMPQAVNEYINTNNLSLVDEVKRDIIKLYLDDFQKIDSSGRIEKLYKNIPAQLSGNFARYQPYQIVGDNDKDKITDLLQCLEESKTVLFCHRVSDPNVGLSLTKDLSRYKIYTADTGLFITLSFWDKTFTENVIYERLLRNRLEANLGYIFENMVAQMLATNGNELFYSTFPKDKKHNYEVDFLLSRGEKIVPIEVKSSGHKSHKSIDEFVKRYSSRIGKRYIIYTKDYKQEENYIYLPVYMTPFI